MTTDKGTTLAKFFEESINNVVELGGTLVSDAEFKRRVSVCNSCEFQKELTIMGVKTEGCIICGCPTMTKPRYDTYFSLKKLKTITAACPHKEGDKWAIAADI